MQLNIANKKDASSICELLNLAYRGDAGWTTECHLVAGNRSCETDVLLDINSSDRYMLVYKPKNVIQACISVQNKNNRAYIGSFAVSPHMQNAGVGKSILYLAEQFAITKFQPKEFILVVLSSRIELIEFYKRRGYERSGTVKPYPADLNVGIPLSSGLTIEELVKII